MNRKRTTQEIYPVKFDQMVKTLTEIYTNPDKELFEYSYKQGTLTIIYTEDQDE